jgi:hypothetical protein
MTALRASSRSMMRAHSPAGMRPPWRSRPSWFFSAFRTEFREQFRLWRHLLIPAAAVVVFLFPQWGIIRPPAYTLVNLLPFTALGWLGLGVIAVAILRVRRPARFETLGRAFMPAEEGERHHDAGVAG